VSRSLRRRAQPERALQAPNSTRKLRGGRRSRDKGNRTERHLVRVLQAAGFAAERIPLSGAAGGSFTGDLNVPLLGRDRRVEVKVRGTGFAQLYGWLAGADLLVVKRDRDEPLVVIPITLAIEIAKAAERGRTEFLVHTSEE
jgi:Holliday junction resolvase